MNIRVNRLSPIYLDFYPKDNTKKNFVENQNEKIDMVENFGLISLDNKEKNKQNLQEAAELISKIQSYESGNFKKACEIYLTKKSDNAQVHHNKGILELVNLVWDFVSAVVANTLRNLSEIDYNMFCEDFLACISSVVSGISRFCCDLCEAIAATGNKRLKYSEVPCSWV